MISGEQYNNFSFLGLAIMLKKALWTVLHGRKLHPNVILRPKGHPLSFMSQEKILDMIKTSPLPEENKDKLDMNKVRERMTFSESQFLLGAERGYHMIVNGLLAHENFLESTFCTPELSLALSKIDVSGVEEENRFKHITSSEENPVVTTRVLGQCVEMQETHSNSKFLGLWNIDHIKSEVFAGMVGPEVKIATGQEDNITYIPARQTVRVLYSVEYQQRISDVFKRVDVFDWERSLDFGDGQEEWTVSNVNFLI